MRKFYDVDHDKIYTEDELRADYEDRKRNGEIEDFYDTFECYLEACMTRNNGSLEEIAPDYEIENKRRWTAMKLSVMTGYFYDDILNVLHRLNIHGNWSAWEIANRPVDLDELAELIMEEL